MSGCQTEAQEEVEFTHIHGLGFTEDGEQAYIPAHDGLRVYEDGTWKTVENGEGELHDFMGFTMTSEGFYSSGHPNIQSDYENPFGLVKSTDGGETLELLALEGEVDFHVMSASYNTDAIYVMNPEPNSEMEELGLHRTLDEGQEWEPRDVDGVNGSVIAIAAHPDEENRVALSTEEGVFQSDDAGDSFEQVLSGVPAPALTYAHTGELLVAEGVEEETALKAIDASGEVVKEIPVPSIEEDAISYLAQNPQSENTIMVTTTERDIFYTENGGETWEQQADQGVSLNES